MESDQKKLLDVLEKYKIFKVKNKEQKPKRFNPDDFLNYDVDQVDLIIKRMSNSIFEFNEYDDKMPLSEVIRLYAIDIAINYTDYKNAE